MPNGAGIMPKDFIQEQQRRLDIASGTQRAVGDPQFISDAFQIHAFINRPKRRLPTGMLPEHPWEINLSAWDNFSVGLKTGLLSPVGFLEWTDEQLRGLPQPEGFAGMAGLVLGGAVPVAATVIATKSPAPVASFGRIAQPVLVSMFASSAAVDKMKETGRWEAALGAGMFEALGEYVGLRYLTRIGDRAATQMGRLILNREYSQAARLAASFAGASAVEGGEELFTLIGTEYNDALFGIKTFEEATANIKRQSPTAFSLGAAGGATTTLLSAGSLAAMRIARTRGQPIDATISEAVREMDGMADNLRVIREEMGTLILEEALPVAPPTPEVPPVPELTVEQARDFVEEEPPVTDVQKEIESLEARDTEALRKEASEVLREDDAAPEGQKLLEADRANVEFVLDELSKPRKRVEVPRKRLRGEARRDFLKRIGVVRPREKPTVTERAALRAGLAKARTAARRAAIEARRIMTLEMNRRLRNLRIKLQAKAESLESFRNELFRVVRETVPKAEQDKLLQVLKTVKDFGGLARGIRRVRTVMAAFERKTAIASLKQNLDELDPATIRLRGLRDIAEDIKSAIRLRKMTEATRRKLESRPEATLRGIVLPSKVLDSVRQLAQQQIDALSTEEIRDIDDTIKRILRQVSVSNKILEERERKELVSAIEGVVRELSALDSPLAKQRVLPPTRLGDAPGVFANIKNLMLGRVENTILPHLMDLLVGTNETNTRENLYERLRRGQDRHATDYYEIVDSLTEFVEELGLNAETLSEWSNSAAAVSNILLKLLHPSLGNTSAAIIENPLESGKTLKWTRMERVHFLAMMQDEEAFDRVIFDGSPLWIKGTIQESANFFVVTLDDFRSIRDSADPSELALADKLVEIYNSDAVRGGLSRWSIETSGRDITKEVGKIYFRVTRIRPKGEVEPDIRVENFGEASLGILGFTKGRVPGDVSPIVIRDALDETNEYAWQSLGLVHRGPAVTNARSVLRSAEVSGVLEKSKLGRRLQERLNEIYDAYVTEVIGERNKPNLAERIFRPLVNNTARAILAGNIKIGLYQPISVIALHSSIPINHVSRAIAEGVMFDSSIDERIFRGSASLRLRHDGAGMAIVVEGGKLGGKAKDDDILLRHLRFADHMTVRVAWRSAEIWAAELGLKGDEALAFTKRMAENGVIDSQPSIDALHMTTIGLIARRRAEFKMLTMFRAQTSKMVSVVLRDYSLAFRTGDPKHLKRAIQTTALTIIGQGVLYVVIRDLFDRLLRGFKPFEDEKEWTDIAEKYLVETLEAIVSLPAFGDFFSNIVRLAFDERPFSRNFTPVLSSISDITDGAYRSMSRARNMDFDDSFWEGLVQMAKGAGSLKGLPVGFLATSGRRIWRGFRESEPKRRGLLLK